MAMLDTVKMRQLRLKRGLSQGKAAKAAGMKPSHWSDYETGQRRNATIERLGEIAKVLGVRPGYLIKE
jgi:transcriptional regulator with XRE-family HTH domain